MSFFEIFDPGMRYLREEKDRQKVLVVRAKHGGGAPPLGHRSRRRHRADCAPFGTGAGGSDRSLSS